MDYFKTDYIRKLIKKAFLYQQRKNLMLYFEIIPEICFNFLNEKVRVFTSLKVNYSIF